MHRAEVRQFHADTDVVGAGFADHQPVPDRLERGRRPDFEHVPPAAVRAGGEGRVAPAPERLNGARPAAQLHRHVGARRERDPVGLTRLAGHPPDVVHVGQTVQGRRGVVGGEPLTRPALRRCGSDHLEREVARLRSLLITDDDRVRRSAVEGDEARERAALVRRRATDDADSRPHAPDHCDRCVEASVRLHRYGAAVATRFSAVRTRRCRRRRTRSGRDRRRRSWRLPSCPTPVRAGARCALPGRGCRSRAAGTASP